MFLKKTRQIKAVLTPHISFLEWFDEILFNNLFHTNHKSNDTENLLELPVHFMVAGPSVGLMSSASPRPIWTR